MPVVVTFEHEIDTMARRDLKAFIEGRGREHADCTGMEELRERARVAFRSPRNSLAAKRSVKPVQAIKAKEAEAKRKAAESQKKLAADKARAEKPAGRVLTKAHRRRKSSSEMTLPTEDQIAERRHIGFHPSKGKLGISLVDRSCEVATIRENSQAHWSGVMCGWVIRKINSNTVVPTDVKPALKACTKGKKGYTIDFDTCRGRESQPLADTDAKPVDAYGSVNTAFERTHRAEDSAWASPQEEIDPWATAGGAGPRRSVMPGAKPVAPGLRKRPVRQRQPIVEEEPEPVQPVAAAEPIVEEPEPVVEQQLAPAEEEKAETRDRVASLPAPEQPGQDQKTPTVSSTGAAILSHLKETAASPQPAAAEEPAKEEPAPVAAAEPAPLPALSPRQSVEQVQQPVAEEPAAEEPAPLKEMTPEAAAPGGEAALPALSPRQSLEQTQEPAEPAKALEEPVAAAEPEPLPLAEA